MNSKQAKEYLELQKARFTKTMAPEMLLATNEAISALGKQVPEKPIIKNELYCCPCCGDNYMLLVGDKRCGECGQLLDWSDMIGHKSNLAPKIQSNYERIKNMSIEEMAAYHATNISCGRCEARKMCKELHTDSEFKELNCVDRFQKWLESEEK